MAFGFVRWKLYVTKYVDIYDMMALHAICSHYKNVNLKRECWKLRNGTESNGCTARNQQFQ